MSISASFCLFSLTYAMRLVTSQIRVIVEWLLFLDSHNVLLGHRILALSATESCA